MSGFTAEELEAAQRAIASTIRKNEKARATLLAKEPPRTGQAGMIGRNLEALYAASALIEGNVVDCGGEEREELRRTLEALRRKVERMEPKFQPGTPQYTLAVRRVRAENPGSGAVMRRLGMRYRYSYRERWMPKDRWVTFRLYQKNLDGQDGRVYRGYWEAREPHFIEEGI